MPTANLARHLDCPPCGLPGVTLRGSRCATNRVSAVTFVGVLAVACGPTVGAAGSETGSDSATASTSVAASSDGSGATTTSVADTSTTEPPGPLPDDDCEFVAPHELECSILAQDCPNGLRCAAAWYGEYGQPGVCVPPPARPKQLGEACTPASLVEPRGDATTPSSDDCALGLECVQQPSGAACRAVCRGGRYAPYCDDSALACVYDYGHVGWGACESAYCAPRCNPLADECEVGVCDEVYGDFVCVVHESPTGAVLSPCTDGTCPPGSLCAPTVLGNYVGCNEACLGPDCPCELCYQRCDTEDPMCSDSTTCTAFNPAGDAGLDRLGLCRHDEDPY